MVFQSGYNFTFSYDWISGNSFMWFLHFSMELLFFSYPF